MTKKKIEDPVSTEPAVPPAEQPAEASPEMAVTADIAYPDDGGRQASPEPASVPGEPAQEDWNQLPVYVLEYINQLENQVRASSQPRYALVSEIKDIRFTDEDGKIIYQLDEFKRGMFILRPVGMVE